MSAARSAVALTVPFASVRCVPASSAVSPYLHARPRKTLVELLPASGVRWLLPALSRLQAPFVVLVEHG